MLSSQWEKLQTTESKYLSIGITPDGTVQNSIAVPWESTGHAFNMRIPDVYIAAQDLEDPGIMEKLLSFQVIGCYIWAPLSDYNFLTKFRDLEDVYIANGDTIRNIDFLLALKECRMFYLQNAKLKNLDALVEAKKNSIATFGGFRCVGLDDCEVEELSVFERESVRFSEFLIWKEVGTEKKDRWNVVQADTHKYYEFKRKS